MSLVDVYYIEYCGSFDNPGGGISSKYDTLYETEDPPTTPYKSKYEGRDTLLVRTTQNGAKFVKFGKSMLLPLSPLTIGLCLIAVTTAVLCIPCSFCIDSLC